MPERGRPVPERLAYDPRAEAQLRAPGMQREEALAPGERVPGAPRVAQHREGRQRGLRIRAIERERAIERGERGVERLERVMTRAEEEPGLGVGMLRAPRLEQRQRLAGAPGLQKLGRAPDRVACHGPAAGSAISGPGRQRPRRRRWW